MSDLAKAGVDQLISVADTTIDAAITAVEATKDVAQAGGQAVVNVSGRTADVMIDELRKLKAQLVESLTKTADAVTDAIPTP